MFDYLSWPGKSVSYTSLVLNPLNPRIPTSNEELPQREVIKELVENDDILGLAKSISASGYFPDVHLVVVKDNARKFRVLEGNRRACAVKLLQSPKAAPEDWVPKFRALQQKTDLELIKKLPVVIAPNIETADPIILERHIGLSIKRWDPIQQSKAFYYYNQNGISEDEISYSSGISVPEVKKRIQEYTIYLYVCGLDLESEVKHWFSSGRRVNFTTFRRIIESSPGKKWLGLSIENDTIESSHDETELTHDFNTILTDLKNEKISSRNLGTNQDIDKYFSRWKKVEPKKEPSTKKKTDISNKVAKTQEKPRKADEKPRKKPKTKSNKLLPQHLQCTVNNEKIIDVFREIQELSFVKFKNAAAVLLRSLIELSLAYHLDKTGDLDVLLKKFKEKKEKHHQVLPKDWHPSLNQMLNYILNKENNFQLSPNVNKVLQKVVSDNNGFVSLDSLHCYAHNQYFQPTESNLREIVSSFTGLLEITLTEP